MSAVHQDYVFFEAAQFPTFSLKLICFYFGNNLKMSLSFQRHLISFLTSKVTPHFVTNGNLGTRTLDRPVMSRML